MKGMKHSIRIRFTLIFIGLMAAALAGLFMINRFFLERFYQSEKVKELEQAYTQVDALLVFAKENGVDIAQEFKDAEEQGRPGWNVQREETPIVRLVRELNEQSNISIAIMDGFNGTIVSFERKGDFLSERFLRNILGQNNRPSELVSQTENYTIQKIYEPRIHSHYLECWGFFSDNGTSFMMSMPIASIQESAALSNRFLAYVGIAVMAGGSILIYFTTRKMVSPILSLTEISERMSNLDFEARYEGKSSDEIGVLGYSMNVLSSRLKEAIGELKTANLQLQRDVEEKIQIDEMRKEFIANVSHELKTPIALIQGYAEGLTEGMATDPESRDYYCEVIMDEAQKMNRMVKQLLTLSALESGKDMAVMERFDLTEMVQGVLSSVKILTEQAGVTAVFDEKAPCFVWADEFKTEEVVTNYLSNALNHVQPGGEIRVSFQQQASRVRVCVFNTGSPVPEEDLPNLWTKFYKVDKARTRAYGGSGIGLSIVKAIMDSHQQPYGAENRESGVVFWFMLEKA